MSIKLHKINCSRFNQVSLLDQFLLNSVFLNGIVER